MPIISRKHRYLFLMAPRTGCTAVGEGALVPHVDGEHFPDQDVFDEKGQLVVDRKHATLGQLLDQGLLSTKEADGLFKFSTVRNPFDALVTRYVRLRTSWRDMLDDPDAFVHKQPGMIRDINRAGDNSFEDWVELRYRVRTLKHRLRHPLNPYAGPRHMYQAYIRGSDFLMRYEHLQEDFAEALRRIGFPRRVEVPQLNTTKAKKDDYRRYYTPKTRAIVERVFALDLERFGYEFDPSPRMSEGREWGPLPAKESG